MPQNFTFSYANYPILCPLVSSSHSLYNLNTTDQAGCFMQRSIFNIIILGFILCSCLKQEEKITPLATVSTLSELQRESLFKTANFAGQSELSEDARSTLQLSTEPGIFYLNVKIKMKNIDVFEVADMPNLFEQIGSSFLRSVVKAVLAISGPKQIDINEIKFSIPRSLSLDRSVVKSIRIKKIFLRYNEDFDRENDFAPNFSFLDSLEISREITVPKFGTTDTLFLSYRQTRNFCIQKCLLFDIIENNLIDLLNPGSMIKLKPTLSIATLPEVNDLKLDGEISLQIGLKLPF